MLNLAHNNLGELVLPEGWSQGPGTHATHGRSWYKHSNGTEQKGDPRQPEGSIALANALPDMRALVKLDISNNDIGQGGSLQLIIEVCDTKSIELDNHESESDGDY